MAAYLPPPPRAPIRERLALAACIAVAACGVAGYLASLASIAAAVGAAFN